MVQVGIGIQANVHSSEFSLSWDVIRNDKTMAGVQVLTALKQQEEGGWDKGKECTSYLGQAMC